MTYLLVSVVLSFNIIWLQDHSCWLIIIYRVSTTNIPPLNYLFKAFGNKPYVVWLFSPNTMAFFPAILTLCKWSRMLLGDINQMNTHDLCIQYYDVSLYYLYIITFKVFMSHTGTCIPLFCFITFGKYITTCSNCTIP